MVGVSSRCWSRSPAREPPLVSARGSPAHPRRAPHARGLFVRPIGSLPDPSPRPWSPAAGGSTTSFVRAPGPSWRLSAIPDAPFGGGPQPLTSRSPASNDSPTALRHTASSHYTWPTVTPRIDPRAERRHPCAPRPPTHSRCLNWPRLRDQNWLSFFDRYHSERYRTDGRRRSWLPWQRDRRSACQSRSDAKTTVDPIV